MGLITSYKFRGIAEELADYIKTLDEIVGRKDVTVIVEDKGSIENIIANALSVAGVAIVIGVTGFDRRQSSGPAMTGTVNIEMRIIERPSVNRNVQGFLTAQNTAEILAKAIHWRCFGTMDGKPMLLGGLQRDDSDQFNIVRLTFSGEAFLGMVDTTN